MKRMFIMSPLLKGQRIKGIFTTRHGGVSPPPFDTLNLGPNVGDKAINVETNLERVLHAAAIPFPHQARQAHGSRILLCQGHGMWHEEDADALVVREKNTAIAVRWADCLPILLADATAGVLAAVHAGWRGTRRCIAMKVVEAMIRLGAQAHRILASLGPHIGPCCFRVNGEIAESLASSVEKGESCIFAGEGLFADLAEINRLQLLAMGVATENIEVISSCTACTPCDYFSHRREQGYTGRHLAIVVQPENK